MPVISDAVHQTNHSPRVPHLDTTGTKRTWRPDWISAILILTAGLCAPITAQAAIPASERQALIQIYTSTNGGTWTYNNGWNGAPGTECTWYRIICDGAGEHVTWISLTENNLSGSLPDVFNNLPNLKVFSASKNQLTGSIPPLTGLANLWYFNLELNQLTGPIPPIAGLTNLQEFYVGSNQLSGSMPPLADLADLSYFDVAYNQLTGPIPPLTGLTSLSHFWLNDNLLTGVIPSLDDLASLEWFYIVFNELTGPVPSLANLHHLEVFRISENHLSGAIPSVPSPSALLPGLSKVCSNHFDQVANTSWNYATGQNPWYQNCTSLLDPIFVDGFDP